MTAVAGLTVITAFMLVWGLPHKPVTVHVYTPASDVRAFEITRVLVVMPETLPLVIGCPSFFHRYVRPSPVAVIEMFVDPF